jgi:hypothetical protein
VSFPEIVSLVSLVILALQMWLLRWFIGTSLTTMRACNETTTMAVDLSHRLLDAAALPPAHQQVTNDTEASQS